MAVLAPTGVFANGAVLGCYPRLPGPAFRSSMV